MGILTNTKNFLAKKATAAALRTADGIAAASNLSPLQIAKIDKKRQEYLSEKPDMTGIQAREIIERNLGAVGIEVYQEYLAQLKDFYHPSELAFANLDTLNRIRYFDITKWVRFSDEQYLDKLANVYQILSGESCNIALIYQRTRDTCRVTLAIVNTDADQSDPAKADAYLERLAGAVQGNFPGVGLRQGEGKDSFGCGIPESLQKAIRTDSDGPVAVSVASISNLASEKSEEFISQSMEKLLDGIIPHDGSDAYTLVLLASPVPETEARKNRLLEISTQLSPYTSWQTNYTVTSSDSQISSANMGVNLGTNAGVQASVANAGGTSRKILSPEENRPEEKNPLRAIGKNVMEGVGILSRPTESRSTTHTNGFQAGVNFGVQFGRSSNISVQLSKGEGVTQSYTDYKIQHALEIVKNQVKRMDKSAALGMWEFAAYVVSESYRTATDVAHNYYSLTQGEESYMTKASIHVWDGIREKDSALCILRSIQKLQHPVFVLEASSDDGLLMYPTMVTPSVCITGKELARALNFPRSSVRGLPVLESISFGRQVQRHGDGKMSGRWIELGNIQHMGKTEETPVTLDVDSLTSHVFITGSTGSGKSNTVYQMLDKLHEQGVKYMVIEPAKGEYKNIFGGKSHVYGTNPMVSELLSINPFSFPDSILAVEHIDRLIEILNACWPMYAAMPAILKEAVEKSYEKVGWNLKRNRCVPKRFPTFADLIGILPEVMESSLYSGDTKSDYSGALITRVQSMTNGIIGQIFCWREELTCEQLFENDVIIDLSRVPAVETKALMMGILIMKLQEYRVHLGGMNEKLLHVTVLEEAHHLLKKTSVAQVQEGANLQGQSVRMLTDSIAEMRTYGEGFFIADQAPELLDEAVIRNTNTKIVLQLPEQGDRTAVGSSMALNERQVTELAKLPKGVAAVYQNNWMEPVLCQVRQFPGEKISPLVYETGKERDEQEVFGHFFKKVFGIQDDYELCEEDVDIIREWMRGLRNSSQTIMLLEQALSGHMLTQEDQEIVAYNLFGGHEIARLLENEPEEKQAIEKADYRIASYLEIHNTDITEIVRNLVVQVIVRENGEGLLAKRYGNFLDGGRVK